MKLISEHKFIGPLSKAKQTKQQKKLCPSGPSNPENIPFTSEEQLEVQAAFGGARKRVPNTKG